METIEVKYRLNKISDEKQIQIITDYNGGIPILDILGKYHISRMTLYRILRRMAGKEKLDELRTN